MIFELFNFSPDRLSERLAKYNIFIIPDTLTSWIDFVILILIVLGVLKVVYSYSIKLILEKKRWQRKYMEEKLGQNYSEYITKRSEDLYIKTRFQSKAPSDYVDPHDSLSADPSENLIDFYVNKVFTINNTNNSLHCVLGGSGMGKTTFAVNLVKYYILKYNKNSLPYDIYILSLSDDNICSSIEKIGNPGRSILILDALDENQEAIKDFPTFIRKLEKSIATFRFVVITCRTQFFADEKSELSQSCLLNYGKEKGFRTYIKHYVSPFSHDEINRYINELFKWKFRKKRRAKLVVDKCSTIMIRPLLLSYIELFTESNVEIDTITDIYELLISKWIEREVSAFSTDLQPQQTELLRAFSQKVALNMYENRNIRAGFFISQSELNAFLEDNSYQIDAFTLTGRSLLNRDATGLLKFSHKSFLEYFIAKEYFENPDLSISFDGMDMALTFFKELCNKTVDDYLRAGWIKIISTVLPSLTKSYTLQIGQNDSLSYRDIFAVYDISTLEIKQSMIDDNLIKYLANTNVQTIIVKSYNGDNLRVLLSLQKVKNIIVEGNASPSKTFMKECRRRGVNLIFDNFAIENHSYFYSHTVPLSVQIRYAEIEQQRRLDSVINPEDVIKFLSKKNR